MNTNLFHDTLKWRGVRKARTKVIESFTAFMFRFQVKPGLRMEWRWLGDDVEEKAMTEIDGVICKRNSGLVSFINASLGD